MCHFIPPVSFSRGNEHAWTFPLNFLEILFERFTPIAMILPDPIERGSKSQRQSEWISRDSSDFPT
jgi:hypothetical protein